MNDDKSYKEYLADISTFIFDVDGVLTDGTITVTTDAGFNVCIISGGSNEGVRKRLAGLGIKDIYLGAHNKIEQFNEYLNRHNITEQQVLYMGDDIPDYPVMKLVGLPCCPQDAVPEIKSVSKYISHKNGGKGAVRDVIEQVLKVQNKWSGNFDAKYD
jgi:3-deoxy-D-manno-octulosonate 8-phosphate phosphatase (KDO 8-P phosphatase)